MIPRDEYLLALDRVDCELIEVLIKWMANEKENLDSFLANPKEHVLYNPFVIPDTVALQQRSTQLEQAVVALTIMANYTKGTATRSQRDFALESMPHVLFSRLLGWMEGRYDTFVKTTSRNNVGAPISEYGDLISFDIQAYLVQMRMYSEAIEGVKIIVQYKKEQEIPVVPEPEPEPPVDPEPTESPVGEPPTEEPAIEDEE